MKILVFDIETAPALAYVWGIHEQRIGAHQIVEPTRMLCFAAKWLDDKKVHFASEHHTGKEQMLADLWALLDEADAVVHYNGKSFDVKHVNREFLLAGMGPPSPYAQIDLYSTVRGQFKFLSNKLDSVAHALEIGGKAAHEGFGLWTACLAGDDKAWGRMKRYNVQDVRLTEALYYELLPWIKTHPSVNLVSGPPFSCPKCGSTDLTKRGFHHTATTATQRYQCGSCGSYSRGGKRTNWVDVRGV